jgi:hypothetical protein
VSANESIAAAEVDLRGLIREVLSTRYGESWLDQAGLSSDSIAHASGRLDAERKRRPGTRVSEETIDYLQFYELKTIIEKHWEMFRPILGPKLGEFRTYFDRLNDLRDADAHNRVLLPFERDLVSGIAGEIRNRITIFRSEMGPKREYYPRIESVVDNFGTAYDFAAEAYPGPVYSDLELTVGTTVEFDCAGWDPHGRELSWMLRTTNSSGETSVRDEASGTNARLRFSIDSREVGEGLRANLHVTSDGKYHRHGVYDDWVTFIYHVVPPFDET